MNSMIIAGIETSCDETAISLLEVKESPKSPIPTFRILIEITHTQIWEHAPFGGIVPELSSRLHTLHLADLWQKCLDVAGIQLHDLAAIGLTTTPGLIGSLLSGFSFAQGLAMGASLPLVPVHHLEAHILIPRLFFYEQLQFPCLAILLSGGHTKIILMHGVGIYEEWGTTLDDALGEAIDKTAKLLGLGYPGGAVMEEKAQEGDPKCFTWNIPMQHNPTYATYFSFSGLKEAVRSTIAKIPPEKQDAQMIAHICASFQDTVFSFVENRIQNAIARADKEGIPLRSLVIGGGVASNKKLQSCIAHLATQHRIPFFPIPPAYCIDNGTMIAFNAFEKIKALGMHYFQQTIGKDALHKNIFPIARSPLVSWKEQVHV